MSSMVTPAGARRAVHCRYQDLSISDLAAFDAILWFAGHSSVPMALKDPDGAKLGWMRAFTINGKEYVLTEL